SSTVDGAWTRVAPKATVPDQFVMEVMGSSRCRGGSVTLQARLLGRVLGRAEPKLHHVALVVGEERMVSVHPHPSCLTRVVPARRRVTPASFRAVAGARAAVPTLVVEPRGERTADGDVLAPVVGQAPDAAVHVEVDLG